MLEQLPCYLKISLGQERGQEEVTGSLRRRGKQEKSLDLCHSKNGRAEKGPCLGLGSGGFHLEKGPAPQYFCGLVAGL